MSLTIRAINTGWIGSFTNRLVNTYKDGEVIKTPSLVFLIEGHFEGPILVDTGMCDSERASKWHHGGSQQQPGEGIHDQLKTFGYTIDDVKHIIFTHLHWDHVQNLDKFPNATLYVQEKEWQFAMAPHDTYLHSYEHPTIGITSPFWNRRFVQAKGDETLFDGIRVILTPGHSPGSQCVLVDTEEGVYCIAGDAVMCDENLKPHPSKGWKFKPIGRYTDVFQVWDSFEKIVASSDTVLAGHEKKVLDRAVYGKK